MDKMIKFSKEWFVTSAKPEIKEAAKNLKQGVDSGAEGNLNKTVFSMGGDSASIQEWIEILPKGSEMQKLIEQYGGFDNLFRLMDTDQDDIISQEETNDAAGADTPEHETRLDKNFNAKDLQTIYENVMAVEEAEVEKTDTKTTYTFKDGTKTEVEYDSDGNVLKSVAEGVDEDGNKVKRTYDKDGILLEVLSANGGKSNVSSLNGLKVTNVTDEQGRIISTTYEGKKASEGKTVETKYNDDGSKVVTTKTIGRTIIENYDKAGNLTDKKETYEYENSAHGALDGTVEPTWQGRTGDCWLIAGTNSLARTELGAKMIKDVIHKNDDGSVTITLKGANKTYTYTPEQIMSYEYAINKEYTATGDLDMNLIEMAVSDYRREIIATTPESEIPREMKDANNRAPLEGGTGEESMFYLTGIKGNTTSDVKAIGKEIDKFQQNPQKYAMVVNFKEDDPTVYCEEAEEFGWSRSDIVEILDKHAYTVNRVDEKNVWLKDPKDSYWEIRYPKDKFYQNVQRISSVDLESAN